jgi:hypothetical protein
MDAQNAQETASRTGRRMFGEGMMEQKTKRKRIRREMGKEMETYPAHGFCKKTFLRAGGPFHAESFAEV